LFSIRFGDAKREWSGFLRLAENSAVDSSTSSHSLEAFDGRDAPNPAVDASLKK
jgi:hypothetical protein